jgi:hypothetical protein
MIDELIPRNQVERMLIDEQITLQELSHRRLEYDDAMYASINARIRLIIRLRERLERINAIPRKEK